MLLESHSLDERKQILRESSYKSELRTYQRKLSSEEVNQRQKQYFQTDELLERELDTLADIKKDYKGRTDVFKSEKKVLAKSIRFKSEEVTGTCFDIVNFEESVMETYNSEGEFIESRPLLPTERQQQIPFGAKLSIAQ